MTRRAVLRGAARGAVAAATAGAAAALGGCSLGGGGRIQVAVPWSGRELELFNQVLDPYRSLGHDVDVTSRGKEIDAFIRGRYGAGNPPDVAILSRPGLMRDYTDEDWLRSLTDFGPRFSREWNEFLDVDGEQSEGGRRTGAWVKVTHKSSFWYRGEQPEGTPSDLAETVPGTYDDLEELVGFLAGREGPAPLAIGAADGWVLADWFENLLAVHVAPAQIETLATGDSVWDISGVRAALRDLARIWRIPGAFPGDGQRALLTQFDEAVLHVERGEAAMLHARDSIVTMSDEPLRRFAFPSPTDDGQPLVVGGDVAVVFNGSTTGRDLVRWLTGPDDAFARWRGQGGYLSPLVDIDDARHPSQWFSDTLVREIRSAPSAGNALQFSLFDRLPGELTGAEGGAWQVLQDFFADIAVARIGEDDAIERAIDSFHEVALRARELMPVQSDSGSPREEGGGT